MRRPRKVLWRARRRGEKRKENEEEGGRGGRTTRTGGVVEEERETGGGGHQGEEGTRHLAEARALVSGGCSCSASVLDSALAAAFKFSHGALTSPCHRTKNMARCTRANIASYLLRTAFENSRLWEPEGNAREVNSLFPSARARCAAPRLPRGFEKLPARMLPFRGRDHLAPPLQLRKHCSFLTTEQRITSRRRGGPRAVRLQ